MAHTDLHGMLTNTSELSQANFYAAVLHVSHVVEKNEHFFSTLLERKCLALNFIKLFALYCSVHFSVANPRGIHLK